MSRRWLFVLAALCVVVGSSCKEEENPLSREEIFLGLNTLPAVYLKDDGGDIIADRGPERFGAVIDPETETLAWIAMTCDNPECPGEGKGKRPYLFTLPHPGIEIGAAGMIQRVQPSSLEDAKAISDAGTARCPACLAAGVVEEAEIDPSDWDPNAESMSWTHIYEPPEAVEERAYLEAQLEQLNERMKQYHGEPGSGQ